MKDMVQLLIDVQELDQRIFSARHKKTTLLKERDQLLQQTDALQELLGELDGRIAEAQTQRDSCQEALQQQLGQVEQCEGRLPEIKTQKEYLAVLKEVDAAKKQVKDLEDALLAKEQVLSELQADAEEKRQQHDSLGSDSSQRCNEIATLVEELDAALHQQDSQRGELIEKIAVPLRKRYELILSRLNGQALVEAREGTCQGCHMRLPPQFFNAMLKNRDITSCPHCNRLLYIAPETH